MVCAVAEPLLSSPAFPLVDVFSRGEGGYYCIKIPYLTTLPNGELLAFGEARVGSCSDYTQTDLVMKRSADGKNWSQLQVFHTSGADTVGNAAPIVTGSDLVVLFNLNNSRVLMKRSSDLGHTWTGAQDISESTTLPNWKWVGLGPPAGLRLSSGRLLIPSYHTTVFPGTVDNGLYSKGHALLSDDDGRTWRLSSDHDFGGRHFPNEAQAVELPGGQVAIFARGFLFERTRTVSPDGGDHWGETDVLNTQHEAFSGCEGSTISCGIGERLVYSGSLGVLLREKMTVMTSDDEGRTWAPHVLVDPGATAYSALAWHGGAFKRPGRGRGGSLGLLYERADKLRLVFEPDHISYVALPSPCAHQTFV